jgi:hypothetical protein
MPVVGFLDARSPGAIEGLLHAFRQGLKDTGHVEGENVAVEYRWADNQVDRLAGAGGAVSSRSMQVSNPTSRMSHRSDAPAGRPRPQSSAAGRAYFSRT